MLPPFAPLHGLAAADVYRKIYQRTRAREERGSRVYWAVKENSELQRSSKKLLKWPQNDKTSGFGLGTPTKLICREISSAAQPEIKKSVDGLLSMSFSAVRIVSVWWLGI